LWANKGKIFLTTTTTTKVPMKKVKDKIWCMTIWVFWNFLIDVMIGESFVQKPLSHHLGFLFYFILFYFIFLRIFFLFVAKMGIIHMKM
jgi:hypothetical protein